MERRLEELFTNDSRAHRERAIGAPPRRAGWPAAAALIAAAAASIFAVLVLDIVRPGSDRPASGVVTSPSPSPSGTPALSGDRKSIVVDGQVILGIDHDAIVEWFRTSSQLCDERNIRSTPDRQTFCQDKASFRKQTAFASVVVSPDRQKIGFTIESATLASDTVAGMFLRSANEVRFLTSYYLGNQFIAFSPSGRNFVYQGSCFEAKCGLFIRDSATLAEEATLNNPDGADRRQNATFVRWISDNEVEYRLGTQLTRHSF